MTRAVIITSGVLNTCLYTVSDSTKSYSPFLHTMCRVQWPYVTPFLMS